MPRPSKRRYASLCLRIGPPFGAANDTGGGRERQFRISPSYVMCGGLIKQNPLPKGSAHTAIVPHRSEVDCDSTFAPAASACRSADSRSSTSKSMCTGVQ